MTTRSVVLRRVLGCALILSLSLAWLAARGAVAEVPAHPRLRAPLRIAITIDDMPASDALPPDYTRERLVKELVDALVKHDVRHATAFVVGERFDGDPDGTRALSHWTEAGFDYGSHTYSHRPLAEVGRKAYVADVQRLEPMMHTLEDESGQGTRFFRFPFLQEGRDRDEQERVAASIRALGYEVARVSLDFRDWQWADAYQRCMARRDTAALRTLSESYLEHASANLEWTREAVKQVLGRPLTQVLLLHANVATAQNLDALLQAYEAAGAEFVSLEEALEDPVYTQDHDDLGGDVLYTESRRSGRPLPPRQVYPMPLLELACR